MNILQQLVQIILLKRSPQDLDFSTNAAVICCILFVYVNYLIKLGFGTYTAPLLSSLVETAALAGFLYFLTVIFSMQSRFIQLCTGFVGVNVIQAAAVVLLISIPMSGLGLGIFVAGVGWITFISLMILSKAFEKGYMAAIFLWFLINLFPSMIVNIVFPNFAKESQEAFQVLQSLISSS